MPSPPSLQTRCKNSPVDIGLKAPEFEIVVVELSWVQILSRTSALPKSQMINFFFSIDKITLFALYLIEYYGNIGNLQSINRSRRVARNLQWGGCFGGLGAKPPVAGGMGVWGRSPQRSKILHFFCKNNFILGLF